MRRIREIATNGTAHIRFVLLPALWLALFAYAGRPAIDAARVEGVSSAIAWTCLLLCSFLPILPMLVRRSDDIRRRSAMHWAGYATLGIFSTLLVLVAVGDIARVLYRLAGFIVSSQLPTLGAHALDFPILGTAGALSLIGLAQARCPRVKHVQIAIDDLPPELDGYTIAQLSDVHVGPTIQRRFVASLVERTNAIGADAIAITGDLIDGYADELRDQVQPLADLKARDGVFYVTGNHEYYWRASEWIPEIESLGMTFLKNEHRVIERGDARLVMAGITDPVGRYTHKSNPIAALDGAPRKSVKVLLSHRPQAAQMASKLGVDLQLSGHTHGGQFFPFNILIRLFQPIVAGLHRVGRTWLYVSRGTGYWGPPSRLGVHGEITAIVLSRGTKS